MGYGIGLPIVWPCPPDWSEPVNESLAWRTDVVVARTGAAQKTQLRLSPRRAFSFRAEIEADVRRLVDAICFDAGSRPVVLPIYPDLQCLAAPLAAGADLIPCKVDGFDFAGQALLWRDAGSWELVSVQRVVADGLQLAAPVAADWPAGTRLYPARRARLQAPAQETMASDDGSSLVVQFALDEPCDWPAAWPSARYRGIPVLEWRPDESRDPDGNYTRTLLTVDNDTGPISYFDLPGLPFRVQSQPFTLWGRPEQARFRALVYALAGRAGQVWVPSWNQDFTLHADAGAPDALLQVAPAGHGVFGRQQVNRRDIRIELYDGTVLYRRITGATDAGDHETLALDDALGVAFAPPQVRCISFMGMCQLASDEVQITHTTDADGEAVCPLSWQAVKGEATAPVAGFGLAFGHYFGGQAAGFGLAFGLYFGGAA